MQELLNSPDMVYVVYTGIGLGVFLLFTGLVQLTSRREQLGEAKSRRMKMIAKGHSTAEILAILKPEEKKGSLSSIPFFGSLGTDLRQAGIVMRPQPFLMLCFIGAFLIFVFGLRLAGAHIAAPVAVLLGIFLPVIVVKAKRAEREKQMVAQLPDSLDLLARGLRVGHPLNTSISAVAAEMADPIASEFGIIFDQVSFGDDLSDAFAEFAERFPLEDVQYLSASVGIQHGTGGDLARVLETLSQTIRGRIALRRRIKAISSEGRLTGWFLSILPFVIFGATNFMSPDYYQGVADDPAFIPMMLVIGLLVVGNALILRKLVNFRI